MPLFCVKELYLSYFEYLILKLNLMRIICLSLMFLTFFMLNANPVSGDSIDFEKESKNYDMFLKSLPDSIDESPVVTKCFDEIDALPKIRIKLLEHTKINGKDTEYYLQFIIKDLRQEIAISMSPDEVQAIIQNLKEIYENTQKSRLTWDEENISYKKLISSRSLFAITLNHNSKKEKWNCQIDISIIDPTNYVGRSVVIYQTVDYKAFCRLSDYERDMPKLIEMLEQGLDSLLYRKNIYVEPKLVAKSMDKGRTLYYIDYGDKICDTFEGINTNANYSEELHEDQLNVEINHKINGIVNDKYKDLKKENSYGMIEVLIDKDGNVLYAQILLNEDINKDLDEKIIVKILKSIKKYRFKSFDKNEYLGIEKIRVKFPLKGNPQYKIKY